LIKIFNTVILSCVISLFITDLIFAQSLENSISLPIGLRLSNQLEYSYDTNSSQEIFENWLNLDYSRGVFSTGIRFDIFQPNDPDPTIARGKNKFAAIDYTYVQGRIGTARKGGSITVGNFYTIFGRGLILKSYENRNIRIDNNLLGVKLHGSFMGFNLIALTGQSKNVNNELKDILHAVDLEYSGLSNFKIGSSFASNQPENTSLSRTMMTSLRTEFSIWNLDFYGEYGVKKNADLKEKIFNNRESIIGKGVYGSVNFYLGSFAFTGEYKYYDNYTFTNQDGTVIYNTPPAVRKEYTYILLNRHPSPLNQSNEKGFQLEGSYYFDNTDYVSVNYGITNTLGTDSYYKRSSGINISSRLALKEAYAEGAYELNESLYLKGGVGYMEELSSDTKSITPILEVKYYFESINTLKFVLEHQMVNDNSTSESYYIDLFSVEYLRSPDFNIALVGEVQTKEPQEGRIIRKFFGFIQIGYKLGSHTDLSLLFGSREAGNICIGGVCRYEPKFTGVEFKLHLRL